MKYQVTNACCAIGNNDFGQIFAFKEGAVTNTCNAVGNGDACEAFAAVEGPFSNACDSVRNDDVGILSKIIVQSALYNNQTVLIG